MIRLIQDILIVSGLTIILLFLSLYSDRARNKVPEAPNLKTAPVVDIKSLEQIGVN